MKPEEKKNQSPVTSSVVHTNGTTLYGTVTEYSPTPIVNPTGMQQLLRWDLDPAARYQLQKSDTKGASWVNIGGGPAAGASVFNGGLQIPGGVPVRLLVL